MAAGKGTRLKSQLPKVLHEVGGKPLLAHVVAAATRVVPPSDVFAIIGHEAERVRSVLASTGVKFVLQFEQRGTGHALMVAQSPLADYDHVIVLSGDAPQITPQTIARLLVISNGAVEKHVSNIFTKLDLPPNEPDDRRVLAVLRWLGA